MINSIQNWITLQFYNEDWVTYQHNIDGVEMELLGGLLSQWGIGEKWKMSQLHVDFELLLHVDFADRSQRPAIRNEKKSFTIKKTGKKFHIMIFGDLCTPSFYRKLKYLSLLTRRNPITLHVSRHWDDRITDINKYGGVEMETLKFIFIMGIEQFLLTGQSLNFDINLVLKRKIQNDTVSKTREAIHKIWAEALSYSGVDVKEKNLEISDVVSISINLPVYRKNGSDVGNKFEEEVIKDNNFTEDFDTVENVPIIDKSETKPMSYAEYTFPTDLVVEYTDDHHFDWPKAYSLSAKSVPYLPENTRCNDPYILKNIKLYYTDKLYNFMWLTANTVLNHWSSFVSSGKVIENFGKTATAFLQGEAWQRLKLIDRIVSNESHEDEEDCFLKDLRGLGDILYKRVKSLFTSQLLILQTSALNKFKDYLIWQAKHSDKAFEFEKGVAILQVTDWFESKTSEISLPQWEVFISVAKKELQRVLSEVAEKFKDSAVSKLISIQKTGKKTSKGKLKQSGIVTGFGITAAVRPRGFGNLQVITSYSQGPHVFNFSLVNDLDVAEQEGQTRIKPIRIQPSLNFDIDV